MTHIVRFCNSHIYWRPSIKSFGILLRLLKLSSTAFLTALSFINLSGQPVDYVFRHINRNEGLSQSNVTSIIQDRKGFMWFGTRDGLNKYDGYKITVYRNDPADPKSISHSYVRSLSLDRKGRLWIGTEDGVNLYNPESDDFFRFKKDGRSVGSNDNKIKAIYEDSKERLWIASGGGLKVLDYESQTFLNYNFVDPGCGAVHDEDIEDIIEDKDGNIAVATWSKGLVVFHAEHRTCKRFRYDKNDPSSLGSDYLKKLFMDSDDNLWIGTTEGGLNLYKRESESFTRYQYAGDQPNAISNNDVLSLAEDDNRNLWIGTQNGGINILNRKNNTFSRLPYGEKYPHGLNSGSVYTIYKDKHSGMWVGTFSGGVNYWNGIGAKFRLIKKDNKDLRLNNNNVLCVYEDEDGDVFIGTDGGGLNIYNKHNKTTRYLIQAPGNKAGISSNYPLCLYKDREGNLWVGSFYGKASVFDKRKNVFHHLDFKTDVDHVAAICEDSEGRMWMGTWGQGLIIYDKSDHSFRQFLPSAQQGSISHNIIFSIYEDRLGKVWVGTEGAGLNLYNRETDSFTVFKADHHAAGSLSNNIINCIYEDSDGFLWIGTNGGLNQFDRKEKKFTFYSEKDGLPNDVVQSIVEDRSGNLWISSNNGISKFNRHKKTFRNYVISDGVQNSSFNRLSYYRNSDGEIYFGGIDGLNFFHPDSITDNDLVPSVHFTELQIFNKPVGIGQENSPLVRNITETTELTLSHSQSVFSLEFAALHYTFPEENQYAYKLEGFDSDWNYIGSQRKATYTNLHPGTYVLKVRASNNDGIWNEEGASMRIVITPPFWKTWWAKTFYIAFVIGILIALRKIFVQRMYVRNRLEMDDMKLRFYANISHEFRTPLTLILGPLNEMSASAYSDNPEAEKLLRLMHRNGQRLLNLINQLMHIYELDAGFAKLKVVESDLVIFCKTIKEAFQYAAEKKGVTYSFVSDFPEASVFFDQDKLEKILLNLLSNAFKYTPDGGSIHMQFSLHEKDISQVPVHIQKKKQSAKVFACISIEDNGIGIPADIQSKIFDRFYRAKNVQGEGTGIGLSLARQLALSHYGDIILESENGKGSKFVVWLPVHPEAFEQSEIQVQGYEISEKIYDLQITEDIVENARSASSDEQAKTLPLLLLVEDNADIRLYLKHNLASAFYLMEAENGKEGIRRAFETIPDIIVTDVMMPEMDGVEMTTALKKDIRTSHIPVILLTARADADFQLKAFENSLADDYITKPFNAGVLIAKLRNMMLLRENLKKRLYAEFVASPARPSVPSIDEIFLKKAMEVVEHNMDDCEFNVERFTREMGMSQTNLYRKFQSLLGVSANEFIRDVRMKRAVQLLETRQYSISEIACHVGFSDAKYFSQAFKKHFKMLPTDYLASRRATEHVS